MYLFFISVSLLRGLPEEKLAKIVDCLEVVSNVYAFYIVMHSNYF